MKNTREVRKIFPHWTRSIGALDHSLALVRSQCLTCGVQMREDPLQLAATFGASSTLVDQRSRCRMVGCHGSVFYLASRTYGRPWIPLVESGDHLEVFETAAKPVNAISLGLLRTSGRK